MTVTDAQLQAALISGAADLSWTDMARLMKKAIVEAYFNSSGTVTLPWQSTTSDGTALVRLPLSSAEAFLDFCVRHQSGGVVPQLTEFRNPQ